jgi:hypothetical protein
VLPRWTVTISLSQVAAHDAAREEANPALEGLDVGLGARAEEARVGEMRADAHVQQVLD